MNEKQIVIAILFGCALIAMGLIPGPLAGLEEGLRNLRDRLGQFPRLTPSHSHRGEWLPGQHWLAVAGFVLITLALLALLAN